MIQDIEPSRLDNAFRPGIPEEKDFVLLFDVDGRILVRTGDGKIRFTTGKEVPADVPAGKTSEYFGELVFDRKKMCKYLDAESLQALLACIEGGKALDRKELFAAFTAYHLWRWYADNRRCGRCGGENRCHSAERALQCSICGHVVYPRINPAVIVGVIKGDSLLITRYRKGYAHNALVAGFTEIGETLEQTVHREVMEETGVRVHNIRYYKSQPWGMAQDLLVGFYCDADEESVIRMDPNELKYAEWVRREDIVLQPNNLSLTNEMMRMFKEGKKV